MRKLTILILLLATLVGCATTFETTESDQDEVDKIVLTNYIIETNILGEGTFNDQEKNLSITAKPTDARNFDQEVSLGNYYGGEHRSVLTTTNIVRTNDSLSTQNEYALLTDKLLDEGLSFADIRFITEIIDRNLEGSEGLYVYTDPDIEFDNIYGVDESNPFAISGRYLTIVELDISNSSSIPQRFCEDNILITSNSTSYSNVPTDKLLNEIPASSLRYELLHKLLIKGCETVPANSTLKTHLIYPSFYDKNEITVHYMNGETVLQEEFQIDRIRSTYNYYFYKVNVEGVRNRGYRIISGNSSDAQSSISSTMTGDYHFVKIGNSIEYVGLQDFFIHEEINFQAVELLTIRSRGDGDVEILKTPITKQAIVDGSIRIEN